MAVLLGERIHRVAQGVALQRRARYRIGLRPGFDERKPDQRVLLTVFNASRVGVGARSRVDHLGRHACFGGERFFFSATMRSMPPCGDGFEGTDAEEEIASIERDIAILENNIRNAKRITHA